MKVREPGPRFRKQPTGEVERIQLMQETLDSQGWKLILDVLLSGAVNTRKRVFGMSNKDELITELQSLRLMKAALERVYTESGYTLPSQVAAIFT